MTNSIRQTRSISSAVPVTRWGKDHWSLLAYIETRCVDGQDGVGTMDRSKVRCNEATHPLCASLYAPFWKPSFGTRLQGYFDFPDRNNVALAEKTGCQLPQHDDWDCLDDLAEAGLVETISIANALVRLTDEGIEVSAKLRAHKARGGMYAGFQMDSSDQASIALP